MNKETLTITDLFNNSHRFLLNEIYHSIEWITNSERPYGKEFYLIPASKRRELNYATTRNNRKIYKEIMGEEVSLEFISNLPREIS
jgi:hypothetical protein